VSTTLAGLCADEVDANIKCLSNMLWVPDHVHNGNASFVQLFYDVSRWDTDGADKELCALVDNDIDQLIEFSTSVVVLQSPEFSYIFL
jgi:hypothetical protein